MHITLQFKKLLAPGKIGQILCLGNITDKDTYEFLRGIAPDLQIVKGDFDVEVVAPIETAGRTCSSTEVRRCLAEGDTRGTQALLGRLHLHVLPGLLNMDSHA